MSCFLLGDGGRGTAPSLAERNIYDTGGGYARDAAHRARWLRSADPAGRHGLGCATGIGGGAVSPDGHAYSQACEVTDFDVAKEMVGVGAAGIARTSRARGIRPSSDIPARRRATEVMAQTGRDRR